MCVLFLSIHNPDWSAIAVLPECKNLIFALPLSGPAASAADLKKQSILGSSMDVKILFSDLCRSGVKGIKAAIIQRLH